MSALKPCPYCGKAAALESEEGHWYVICPSCLASTVDHLPNGAKQKEAVAAWNRRAPDLDILDALHQCAEYLENRSDVQDGDYGIPEANEEMRLLAVVKEAIKKAES